MKKAFMTAIALLLTVAASAQHAKYVGGDISLLPLYEEHSSGFLDGNGQKIDNLITWLKNECGWNSFRVRLFVKPNGMSNDGKSVDPAVCQDLDYVKSLGKRIKDAGGQFLLDFHYSDTWMDATHIQAPSECSGMTASQKADWLYSYTKQSLQELVAAGATPDLVQIGNEIMYGFMGIAVAPYDKSGIDWTGYLACLRQGCKATREVCPQAKIIIHTDRPCNAAYNKYYYSKLADIDYDIIGLSYYPFWHGTLSSLATAITTLKSDFPDKPVQIVETGYYFQWWPSSGVSYDTRSTWAASETGQYNFVKDLVAELSKHDNCEGLFYWCPEDAGTGDDYDTYQKNTIQSGWTNRGLWWPSSTQTGHWPVSCSAGMAHYLLRDMLDPTISGISTASADSRQSASDKLYNLLGQPVNSAYKGIVIENGRKHIK